MQKEELLHLHMLMVQIKKYYESVSNKTVSTDEYDALKISPIHIHKNKNLHRIALMTLGNEVVSQMRADMESSSSSAITSEKSADVSVEHS